VAEGREGGRDLKTRPTVAAALAATLQEAGVTTVFGLPGGENVEVLEALRVEGIRFLLVRNESSALFMADAQARLTGAPGVCLTTLGPGATNAYVGLAHAHLDRSPLLLITAQTAERLLPEHTHQVLDLQAVFAPITKATRAIDPRDVRRSVRAALALTLEGRPGPVHLSLSRSTAARPAEGDAVEAPAAATTAPDGDFGPALAALARSQRPVIVAGLGLEPERPYRALQALAEAAGAPVITTPKAKGSLPDDHPLAAGTIGLTRTDPSYTLLAEADHIVAVGFDVVELVRPWDDTAPLVWLAPWANRDPTLPAVAEIVGPQAPALLRLAEAATPSDPSWGAARVATFREALARRRPAPPTPGRTTPQAIFRALRRQLPRDTPVATDVGSHKIAMALDWPSLEPNRYLVSNGLSAMGFGLPAAIAAALTLQRPTLCVTGDAGLAMVLGELGLLAELELPVVVVVMNDSAIDLIRGAQRRAGGQVYGTTFRNPDFAQIAAAFGLDYAGVADGAACEAAVEAALATRRPTLIDAWIDPGGYSALTTLSPPT
jgi:acetolactate synthase-1/2/3 large subunit